MYLMSILRNIYIGCLLSFLAMSAAAQNVDVIMQPSSNLPLVSIDSSAKLVVRNIIIKGNKKISSSLVLYSP